MSDNERIIEDVLDSIGCLETNELYHLIANIELIIENRLESELNEHESI